MVEIIWAEQAIEDWESIAQFHSATSIKYMTLILQEIERGVSRLARFPFSGRVVPEINNLNIREIVQNRYRVLYEVRDDALIILTIHPCLIPLTE